MYYDRVRYFLDHEHSKFEVLEPINWNKDDKIFTRNENYHGITTELSGELIFVKSARDYLIGILEEYGINTDLKLTREIKNPQTDLWEKDYEGWVDFLTYKITDTKFTVKFNSDPLVTKFKSKQKSTVELERRTNLEDEEIPELEKIDLHVIGRRILTTSNLIQPAGNSGRVVLWAGTPDPRVICVDLHKLNSNIDNVGYQSNTLPYTGRDDIDTGYAIENFFQVNQTGVDLSVDLVFKLKMSLYWARNMSYETPTFGIQLVVYENGDVHDVKERITIYEKSGTSIDDLPVELDIFWELENFTIAVDESASIQFYTDNNRMAFSVNQDFSDYTKVDGTYIKEDGSIGESYYEASLSVQEDSKRPPSNSPGVMLFEYIKRLNDIVLGANFESDLLGRATMDEYSIDGDFSQTALSHGMWFRGMDGADKYKPISTSLQDCINSVDAVYPIGISLKDNMFKLEARDYFYQKYVSISIGEVTGLVTEPSTKDYDSTISVGYEKAGGHEEEQGLDEYNRKTEYNTILNKTDLELELISKYRADGYGMETIRRENPAVEEDADVDKDNKFDDNIWLLDVNLPDEATSWIISTWDKRFAVAPTQVYSPDTAINLWLSPINVLLRYGKWIKPSLLKYLDSKIDFNFSEGNSKLTTQLIGGVEYTQNDGIPVADFERSAHAAEIATFKAPVTWEQLNGNTFDKPNVYGLVEGYFKGQRFRGHILSVSLANGIGDFKIKLYS